MRKDIIAYVIGMILTLVGSLLLSFSVQYQGFELFIPGMISFFVGFTLIRLIRPRGVSFLLILILTLGILFVTFMITVVMG